MKYPQVKIKLIGQDGNAFTILAIAVNAAKKAGLSKDVINAYRAEAMSGDYNHLLVTAMQWFNCDGDDDDDDDADYYNDEYDDDDADYYDDEYEDADYYDDEYDDDTD